VRLRDALSGELRELAPGPDGVIGMYVCGPTVYGRIHIGNARPFVVSVVMRDYLRWRGKPVRLVENITDINDKIYIAARPQGVPSEQLAREMADHYIADTDRLGLGRPDVEPRATDTLPEIVSLISELVEAGHAYEAGGDVYFAVRSFAAYGALSRQRLDDLEAGSRVEPGEHKRDPLDFTLWKANKPDEDSWWDSPWGRGRPGWHIECSAMAEKYLGREFAMHGGGRDLIFPHHENEVAQSRAGGRGFAEIWAHNGMLRMGGEKMSKSEGNIDLLHKVLDRWGAETVVMFMLRAHYASPMDYTDDVLEQARAQCQTLRNRLREAPDGDVDERSPVLAAVRDALDDDFNTPQALAALFDAPTSEAPAVREVLGVLGLGGLSRDPEPPEAVVQLAESRTRARAAGDYAESDRLRDEISAAGWEVRDTADGFLLYPHG
jgi:cysteinyl-tRNA synthetase